MMMKRATACKAMLNYIHNKEDERNEYFVI